MTRVAVKIAYLGDGFSGSQVQPGFRTVEREVLRALVRTGGGRSEEWFGLRMAGRTDAGVSALGNVASFETAFDDPEAMLDALNAVADGVFFLAWAEVDDDFRPRHARRRVYRYTVPSDGLDIGKARECASLFEGEHDFVRFCRPDGKPTVSSIDSVTVAENGGTMDITFTAGRFLWNMIRRIVPAIVAAASGKADLSEVRSALEGEDRTFGLADAGGLVLMEVEYDDVSFTPHRSPTAERRLAGLRLRNSLERRFLESL